MLFNVQGKVQQMVIQLLQNTVLQYITIQGRLVILLRYGVIIMALQN